MQQPPLRTPDGVDLLPFDPNMPPWATMNYEPVFHDSITPIIDTEVWQAFIWKSYVLKCVDLDAMQERNDEAYPLFNQLAQALLRRISSINKIDPALLCYLVLDVSCGTNMLIN